MLGGADGCHRYIPKHQLEMTHFAAYTGSAFDLTMCVIDFQFQQMYVASYNQSVTATANTSVYTL